MFTKTERRVLYLLRKNGGRALRSELSQGMARLSANARSVALNKLEDLEQISSAKTPPRGSGGRDGLVYWLTVAGNESIQDLINTGEMQDPTRERRGKHARAVRDASA